MWAGPAASARTSSASPARRARCPPEKKPRSPGIFTDLKVPRRQPGRLSARIDIDTRFITSPTRSSSPSWCSASLCVVASIVALAVLDRRSGRRRAPGMAAVLACRVGHWLADVGVIGTLLLWHVIGAISSDDGYNLTIARVSGEAGYTANYFRFFGATEAPFDWYQSVLAHLASVSTAGRVDAAARHRRGHRHLADPEPLRPAATGPAAGRSTGWRCGPRARCSWPPGCRSTTAFAPSR